MMIKSAPPASANLAEIPVPAPTPRMGAPCRTVSRSLARHWSRESIGAPDGSLQHTQKFGHDARSKLQVVNMCVDLPDLHTGVTSNRLKQGTGSGGIVEGLSGGIDS